MKNSNRIIRLCFLLGGLSLIAFMFYYPTLPSTVPIHWNAAGEIDGWGHKGYILFFAAMPLLNTALFAALPRLDPRRESYARHARVYNIFALALTLVFIAVSWMMVLTSGGLAVPVGRILPALMGILFLVLGNWMPQLKPNWFMGIRTPWALENETVWRKTHRMGGILFVVFGVLLTLAALLPAMGNLILVLVVLLLVGCVGLFLYSYLVYKKLDPRKDDDNAED